MSFAPPVQTKTGGVDGRNLATTQEGIPLPWFCGIRRLKANWITQATNRRTRDGRRRKGEHWFCQVTAAFGYGPAAGMLAMYYNGKYRDYGFEGEIPINQEDYPGYYDISPNDFGLNGDEQQWEGAKGRIHWGKNPAPVDPQNPAASYPLLFGSDDQNPRYWRVILVEWNQLFLGINNPARMPNIEATFARHAQIPAGWTMATDCQYWVGGSIGGKNWTHGVPPVPALLEILTDKHTGFARDPDSLDQSTWEGIAGELTADKWRINPLIDQPMTEDAVIETFLKYFDGYTYYRNGKLALGRRPDTITILVPADYTEFTSHDMTRPPNLKTTRPDETINEVGVTWIDPTDLQYKEVAKTYDAPANREARGEPVREDLDLSWKLIEYDVDSYVRKFLGHAASVRQMGSITVRENRCVDPLGNPLDVGDVVFLDQSIPQLDHAYRINARKRVGYGEIQLDLETERGQYPLAYVAPSDPVPNNELPDVDGIGVVKWLELPYELTGIANRLTIFPILKRNSGTVAGCTLWFKDDELAFHPVADYGPLAYGSSGSRVAADSIDEEYVRQFTVSGAGTAAVNGVYTKGADIGGSPAWYGPGGHVIKAGVASPWILVDGTDTSLYTQPNVDWSGAWEDDQGATPVPTVDPDLWLLRATLDDAEQIIATQTKGQAEDNTLLMCQGLEIYSVELVLWDDVAGNYKILAWRERLGSLRQDHGGGGTLAFVRRSSIQYLGHEFLQYGETITYKLQPRNWAQAIKLEDATEQQFTLSDQNQWLPSLTVTDPPHDDASGNMTGFQYIGDDIDFEFDATSVRGGLLHASLIGYRFGASKTADQRQDVAKVWDQPASQTNFKAAIEIPILEWYAMTAYASNRYGTTSKTIWAYAFKTPLPDGLDVSAAAWAYDITWTATNLPDRLHVVQHEVGSEEEGEYFIIEGDVLAGLHKRVRVEKQVTYNITIWAGRTVNGKEYLSDYFSKNVAVGAYTAVPQNGGAAIWTAPNPYQGILYWDGAALAAMVGSDGFLSYQLYHADDGADSSIFNAFPAGNGQANISLPKAGTWWVNVWAEDKNRNKGPGQWLSVVVNAYGEPTITSVTKPEKYTLRVFYDPATMQKFGRLWYWPNYTDGFKERKWVDYEETVLAPDNYIDVDVIRADEYRLSLYTFDEQYRPSGDPSTTGVAYVTPDAWAAPAQKLGATIVTTPNPKEVIFYHDESLWTNDEFYFVYQIYLTSNPKDSIFNYFKASDDQMNQPVHFTGNVTVKYWIEDKDSRKGVVTTVTKTVFGYSAPDPVSGLTVTPNRGHNLIAWTDPTMDPVTQGEVDALIIERKISGEAEWSTIARAKKGVGKYADSEGIKRGKTYLYRITVRSSLGIDSPGLAYTSVSPSLPSMHSGITCTGYRAAFSDADIDTTENSIYMAGNTFVKDERVVILKVGAATMPGGLTEGTIYWIAEGGTDYPKLRDANGNVINITSTGSGGFHLYAMRLTVSWTETDSFLTYSKVRYKNTNSSYRTRLVPDGVTEITITDYYPFYVPVEGGYFVGFDLQDSFGLNSGEHGEYFTY